MFYITQVSKNHRRFHNLDSSFIAHIRMNPRNSMEIVI